MSTYNNLGDNQLRTWANSFAATAAEHMVALGLDEGAVQAIEDAVTAFGTSLDGKDAAYDTARSTTVAKDAAKQELIDVVRLWANQWQANPEISNVLKTELGLPIHDTTPTPRPVFAPSGLFVEGCADGTNSLKWNRNGNFPFTSFVIEVKYDSPFAEWQYAGTTTKSRFDHMNQTPGRYAQYRVFADRTGQKSAPSNSAVIYGNQEDGGMEAAA